MRQHASLWLFSVLCLCASLVHASAEAVARVVFVHGEVSLSQAAATPAASQAVVAEQALSVGSMLSTGEQGHLQLKFIDGAFVSLRPNSRLVIEAYEFSAQAAQNTVRFRLEQGTGRFVTGRAGQANKAGFRVNTPLAAIGIRGTDFTVFMQGDLLQTRVAQGAIVLSPFGPDCLAEATGACGGAAAKLLTERDVRHILQLRASDAQPMRVPVDEWQPAPLAEPVAPSASASPSTEASTTSTTSTNSQPQTVASSSAASESGQVYWGRWDPEAHQAELDKGSEFIGRNQLFALYRQNDQLDLPTSGVYRYELAFSEAYALDRRGRRQDASLSNGFMEIDFANNALLTQIIWRSGDIGVVFGGEGRFDSQGRLWLDSTSNMKGFSGALNSTASSAAYIFEGVVPSTSLRAYGVTRWSRL